MTLLSVLLTPSQAIAAVDSQAFDADGAALCTEDGAPCDVTKVVPLATQPPCLLALHGSHSLLAWLLERSLSFRDIDTGMDVMPELLFAAGEVLPLKPIGTNVGTRVHLIGHSRKYGRMVRAEWFSKDGFKTFKHTLDCEGDRRIVMSPKVPREMLGEKLPRDTADMMRAVRAQAKHAQGRGLSVGGRAVLYVIDRHHVEMKHGDDLGMPCRKAQASTAAAVTCTLQEDSPEIYDEADAADPDPTPNTRLPNPWSVQQIQGLAATSNSTTALKSNTGTLVPRVSVTWSAVTDRYVLEKGKIRIRWRYGSQPMVTQDEPGNATGTYIVGPQHGDRMVIQVFAVNGLGKEGPPATIAHTVSGAAAIGTSQLSTGAATETQSETVSGPGNLDVNNSTATNATIGTLQYTNSLSTSITVQFEFQVVLPNVNWATAAPTVASWGYRYDINGVQTGAQTLVNLSVAAGSNNVDQASFTMVSPNITLAAGATLDVFATRSLSCTGVANMHFATVFKRVTAIRR